MPRTKSRLMLPSLATPSPTDGRLTNAEHFSKHPLLQSAFSDHPNIISGQFGVPIPFASGVAISVYHFSYVLGLSSKMKMVGLNANWSVTIVKHVQTIGGAFVDSVRRYMSTHRHTFSEIKNSVSVAFERAPRPVPASFGRRITRQMPGESFSFGQARRFLRSISGQRIAVPHPSAVVGITPPAFTRRFETFFNRALRHNFYYTWCWGGVTSQD